MYYGTLKNGRPINEDVMYAYLATLKDGTKIKVEKVKEDRSSQQNRFYWKYLQIISDDTGDSADDLHEFFKRKFLIPRELETQWGVMKIPGSTTKLSKVEFGDYMDRICALTQIPIPQI